VTDKQGGRYSEGGERGARHHASQDCREGGGREGGGGPTDFVETSFTPSYVHVYSSAIGKPSMFLGVGERETSSKLQRNFVEVSMKYFDKVDEKLRRSTSKFVEQTSKYRSDFDDEVRSPF